MDEDRQNKNFKTWSPQRTLRFLYVKKYCAAKEPTPTLSSSVQLKVLLRLRRSITLLLAPGVWASLRSGQEPNQCCQNQRINSESIQCTPYVWVKMRDNGRRMSVTESGGSVGLTIWATTHAQNRFRGLAWCQREASWCLRPGHQSVMVSGQWHRVRGTSCHQHQMRAVTTGTEWWWWTFESLETKNRNKITCVKQSLFTTFLLKLTNFIKVFEYILYAVG